MYRSIVAFLFLCSPAMAVDLQMVTVELTPKTARVIALDGTSFQLVNAVSSAVSRPESVDIETMPLHKIVSEILSKNEDKDTIRLSVFSTSDSKIATILIPNKAPFAVISNMASALSANGHADIRVSSQSQYIGQLKSELGDLSQKAKYQNDVTIYGTLGTGRVWSWSDLDATRMRNWVQPPSDTPKK